MPFRFPRIRTMLLALGLLLGVEPVYAGSMALLGAGSTANASPPTTHFLLVNTGTALLVNTGVKLLVQ